MHKPEYRSDTEFYFVNILISIDKIKRNTENTSPYQMVSNEQIFSIVIRELQEIGESAKKLLCKFTIYAKSNIEWEQIIGFRNLVVHQYFSVDPDIIFEIVQKEVPQLQKNVLELIKKLSDKTEIYMVLSDLKTVFQKIGRHETVAYLIELEDWIRNLARV
jgi:uncharacterized protein with HEPN domain